MKKNRHLFYLLVILSVMVTSCSTPIDKPDKIDPVTKMDSISYIIGYDYGQGIHDQEIEANPMMVYKGLYDALNEKDDYLPDSVRERLINEFQKKVKKMEDDRFQKMVAKNKEEGKKFIEENKKAAGVVELPDGLQYKILKLGNGKSFPAPNDSVLIHYRAMYTDRTTFDMSYETGPVGIRINHLVKGLSEGIRLMKKGAIYEFYIPPDLGYGDQNYQDKIPGGSTVIYSVELIDVYDK